MNSSSELAFRKPWSTGLGRGEGFTEHGKQTETTAEEAISVTRLNAHHDLNIVLPHQFSADQILMYRFFLLSISVYSTHVLLPISLRLRYLEKSV